MIDEIGLRNLALIREASMRPASGLTVVTGESGSGKTAFLSGVKLLVGERGSADLVREGEAQLEVEGRFFPRGDSTGEGTVVSRAIASDGRSRVRVNGSMATVRDVADEVGGSVDLCGQHEHQRLTRPASQVSMLDDWAGAGLGDALRAYGEALSNSAAARQRLNDLERLRDADLSRLEDARFILRRIDEVDPLEGEYEDLLEEVRRMENLEDLARATEGAHGLLSGDGGAIDSVNRAVQALVSATSFDGRLAGPAKALQEACYILDDAARDIDALVPDADSFDARRLEELQDRVASFQGLMRSYGPTMEEVLARRDEARRTLDDVEDLDARLDEARRAAQLAEEGLRRAADDVSHERAARIPDFEAGVNALLERLEMPGCAMEVACTRLDRAHWGDRGPDRVEFMFRPGAGMEPRPLNRIASGGEMSRVTLAVKAVLGEADAVDTLVFDEVDAGVGGKAALAVGEVLRDLACSHQVIVVTHLAQIAALGDVHYVVERVEGDMPETRMREVSGSDRVREVARMLSGTLDNTSLVHAEALLRR